MTIFDALGRVKWSLDLAASGGLIIVAGMVAHQPAGTPTGTGIAVAAIPVGYVENTVRRRQEVRRIYSEAIAAALAFKDGSHRGGRLKVTPHYRDWQGLDLDRITVRYPSSVAAHSPKVAADLTAYLTTLIGADLDIVWRYDRRFVTITRAAAVDPRTARLRAIIALAFGADAKVLGDTWDDDELVSFTVTYPATVADSDIAYRTRLDAQVTAKTGRRWTSRWEPDSDRVTYRTRRPMRTYIAHPADALPGSERIPYGEREDGTIATWDLTSMVPHVLVTGATGAGKTQTIGGLAMECAKRSFRVVVIDPKRISLIGLKGWPNVEEYHVDPDGMAEALSDLVDEMMARYERIEKAPPADRPAVRAGLRPIVIVIEELAELIAVLGELHTARGGKGDPPAVVLFRRLARLGREARVHLIAGIQQANGKTMTTEARGNFGLAIAVGRIDEQLRKMVGVTRQGSDLGPDGKSLPGRAIVRDGTTEYEVQVWYTPDPTGDLTHAEEQIIEGLYPTGRRGADRKHLSPAVSSVSSPVSAPGERTAGSPVSNPGEQGAADGRRGGFLPALDPATVDRIHEEWDRGATQRRIAEVVGVSTGAVAKHTRGRPRPAVEEATR